MAKKKRKPDGERPKRRPPRHATLPDRRAMEGMMQQLVAGVQGEADQDTPLGKAQALMYQAFEERDKERRVQLAKEALGICLDCADAVTRHRQWTSREPGSNSQARRKPTTWTMTSGVGIPAP